MEKATDEQVKGVLAAMLLAGTIEKDQHDGPGFVGAVREIMDTVLTMKALGMI